MVIGDVFDIFDRLGEYMAAHGTARTVLVAVLVALLTTLITQSTTIWIFRKTQEGQDRREAAQREHALTIETLRDAQRIRDSKRERLLAPLTLIARAVGIMDSQIMRIKIAFEGQTFEDRIRELSDELVAVTVQIDPYFAGMFLEDDATRDIAERYKDTDDTFRYFVDVYIGTRRGNEGYGFVEIRALEDTVRQKVLDTLSAARARLSQLETTDLSEFILGGAGQTSEASDNAEKAPSAAPPV